MILIQCRLAVIIQRFWKLRNNAEFVVTKALDFWM